MTRRESIIAGLAAITAASVTRSAQAQEQADTPQMAEVRALLKAHDQAMTNQDLNGVMACMLPKAAIMGTGPGEIWSGPDEIKAAYEHFFQNYDKGHHKFDYQFKIGALGTDMGWLMASGNIAAEKDGKPFEFPLNVSLTVARSGGKWYIASMHFSTLTGPAGAKDKQG